MKDTHAPTRLPRRAGASSFLLETTVSFRVEGHTPLTERPGNTVGRYKLMEQIGEAGMGVVFVAEQARPIRLTNGDSHEACSLPAR
jgi:hypothetical protein